MTFERYLNKDIVGGVLVFALGIAVSTRSILFSVGTLNRMGPGYFPLVLGLVLTFIGIAIVANGYLATRHETRKGSAHSPEWRAWLLISFSIVIFIALAKFAGLVPATFAIVFISALADRDNSWRDAALLGFALVVVSIVVFWWGLRIQLPLFKWGGL